MLTIFKNPNYDFQSRRKIAFIVSSLVILIGLIFTFLRGGPNYSIDFTGGTQFDIRFETPVDEADLRLTLAEIGYPDAEVKAVVGAGQQDMIIRIAGDAELAPVPVIEADDSTAMVEEVASAEGEPVAVVENPADIEAGSSGEAWQGGSLVESVQSGLHGHYYPENPFEVRSVDQVGPKIGHELRKAALLSIISSMFFIIIYLSWRFQFRYGVAAIIALAHDVLIVFGLFSIFDLQMSLAVIAAFLTIVGYSLNDTIVVFDRVRENVKKLRTKTLVEQINTSINETLNRTILTSGTTLIVVLVLYFLGGPVIHDFAFALMAGVVVGTYSSIFVASPILVEWNARWPEKRKKR